MKQGWRSEGGGKRCSKVNKRESLQEINDRSKMKGGFRQGKKKGRKVWSNSLRKKRRKRWVEWKGTDFEKGTCRLRRKGGEQTVSARNRREGSFERGDTP